MQVCPSAGACARLARRAVCAAAQLQPLGPSQHCTSDVASARCCKNRKARTCRAGRGSASVWGLLKQHTK